MYHRLRGFPSACQAVSHPAEHATHASTSASRPATQLLQALLLHECSPQFPRCYPPLRVHSCDIREHAALPALCRVAELIPTDDINRVIEAVKKLPTTLERYSYLAEVRNTKPGLFFAAVQQRPVDLLPIVYTPGVGEACLNWGFLPTRPRVLVLAREDRGQMAQLIRAWSPADMQAVVVTDGARPSTAQVTACATLAVLRPQHRCKAHGSARGEGTQSRNVTTV